MTEWREVLSGVGVQPPPPEPERGLVQTCSRAYCAAGHTEECLSLAEAWWGRIEAKHRKWREDRLKARRRQLESFAKEFFARRDGTQRG